MLSIPCLQLLYCAAGLHIMCTSHRVCENWRDFPSPGWQNGVCTSKVYTFGKNRPNPHRGTLLPRLQPREGYTGDSSLVMDHVLGYV